MDNLARRMSGSRGELCQIIMEQIVEIERLRVELAARDFALEVLGFDLEILFGNGTPSQITGVLKVEMPEQEPN